MGCDDSGRGRGDLLPGGATVQVGLIDIRKRSSLNKSCEPERDLTRKLPAERVTWWNAWVARLEKNQDMTDATDETTRNRTWSGDDGDARPVGGLRLRRTE